MSRSRLGREQACFGIGIRGNEQQTPVNEAEAHGAFRIRKASGRSVSLD